MSDKYDEDLYENPFFNALQRQFPDILNKAAADDWLVCIPQFKSVPKQPVNPADVEDHVLVPRGGAEEAEDARQLYQSLSSKDCEIVKGKIVTKQGYEVSQEVVILFEETFHTDNDESYRVVCVDRYLNSKTDAAPPEEGSTIKRPTSYEQCIDLLWNHTGGWKARDNIDKMLSTFSMAFDQLEGQGLRSIMDAANAQFTKVMQYVLKDSVLKRTARHDTHYMENIKIAVETYYMHAVFRKLFRVVTACMGSEDADVNKLTRNLTELTLQDLGIKKVFSKNVSLAKVELSRLNNFTTPVGRLFCVKRVVAALTKPRKGSGPTGPEDMMTTDDFLPILIYLIVKSEIPNWTANLAFMTHFHFAKCSEDAEFGFYLASIEAALEHIKSGKMKDEVFSRDMIKDHNWQGVNGVMDDGMQRQSSGPNLPVVEEFFQQVQNGDEALVQEMLEQPKKASDELVSRLCHPLCSCDRCEKIQAQIRSNSNLVTAYTRDTRGYTALHIAASCGQAQLIDVLVKHGAVVDAADYLGLTPLHLACQKGFQSAMLLLLHFHASITAVDSDGNTPLHLCAANGHDDCVKALIFFDNNARRICINALNDIGNTPLHLASKWGYETIVKVLLENNADPNIRNRKKQTPLSLTQNVNVQRLLTLSGRGIMILPTNSQPIMPTVKPSVISPTSPISPTGMSRVQRVNSIISTTSTSSSASADTTFKFETATLDDNVNEKIKKKLDKLFRAIIDGDTQLVKFYLGFDSPTDDFDDFEDNSDVMDSADQSGDLCHPLCQCSKCRNNFKSSPRSSSELSVNTQSTNGYSPLHMAVLHQQTDLISLFLLRGAVVNVHNQKLTTSVHMAICVQSEKILKTLLDAGGSVGVQDINGDTPLHISCAKGFAAGVNMLLQHRASVMTQNRRGNTPLHLATERNHPGIVQILINHGADVRVKNIHGMIPTDLTQNSAMKRLLESQRPKSQSEPSSSGNGGAAACKGPDNPKRQVGIQDLFAAFEESDLHTLKNLTSAIRSFDGRHSLRRTSTRDLSAPRLDAAVARNLSIRNFDHNRLRHTDSVNKCEPLYIYKLAMQGQQVSGVSAEDFVQGQVIPSDSDSDDDLFRKTKPVEAPQKVLSESELTDLIDVEL
ncbi:ankyrin repeat domain-containing protein 27-like [Haliotis cracherodii]|uniref:ankyrin repeat domain-containing protein 27-like n=1 Tax=Haliotis cracherodii TaxID=6455 RepID=UPI0039EA1F5D